ncbi:unnamed protein product [Leptosia nina]|uniref:UDP-N-acetylglucosamine transporter n=1 Tax=Leptosia nina TaxID=320188 RepID=A0AAV1JSW8_9NEOP
MKSANDVNPQETQEHIELEAENITPETQLNLEEMDSENKKEKTYSPNRQVKYGYIKYVSLAILTVQNAALGLSMRYARTRKVEMFSSAAAVLMTEFLKLAICIVLVINESGSIRKGTHTMYSTVLNIKDTLRVGLPSFLYVIQNNLLYVATSNLDAATYQVTFQLKLLTTAVFAVLVLKRRLKRWQWGALGLLVIGVALVQLTTTSKGSQSADLQNQSKVLGFSSVLAACVISGFAGIYFEKVLKESDISVWMRNVQLSLLSLPIALITYLIDSKGSMSELLKGFDGVVWYLVVLQAAGDLEKCFILITFPKDLTYNEGNTLPVQDWL